MSIEHVSDTARWVAIYRAMETERPDAIFRDPFARRLAGEKGERIVQEMRRGRDSAWAMIVRTAVMDELLRADLARGADTVVNLAAGLDARPWRMDLPGTLRWVDVDFAGILDYKLDALAAETPRCDYRAIRADLTDGETRRRALDDALEGSSRAVVITEGLLIYLQESDVVALAQDLHAAGSVRWWITDLASPRLLKWMSRSWGKRAAAGNAPFRFAPESGTAFFRPFGWKEETYLSSGEEARRLNREMKIAWIWKLLARTMPAKRKEEMRRMAGILRLERADD